MSVVKGVTIAGVWLVVVLSAFIAGYWTFALALLASVATIYLAADDVE